MGWKVWGNSYDTDSDFTNGTKTCRFTPTKNIILQNVRTGIIFYNNPGLVNITAKIYIDDNESKGDLLYTSLTTHLKADLINLNHGVKEIYFLFDEVPLHADEYYHFVLSGTSSGFSESSHVAWKSSYPDPVYSGGFTGAASKLPQYPFDLTLIGADF